jgi:hypothetical protein
MAFGSPSSNGRPQDATLASKLGGLEIEARAAAGAQYSRSQLAEESGVPEAKFVFWLMGDAVSGDDDDGLMAVVSMLALWAGQSPPERRRWLLLAAATRGRQEAGAERKAVVLLKKLYGLLKVPARYIAGIVAVVIGGVAIYHLTTPGPAPQPAVPFGYQAARTVGPASGCAAWLFLQPIQKIPYTNLGQDADLDETWALSHGAADVDGGAYTIALKGDSATDPVVIRGVYIKILSSKPAQAATVIYNHLGCGGALASQLFTVQVDSPNPEFVAQNGAVKWPYTISLSDTEYLILDAQLSSSDKDEYQFVYQIEWSQGGPVKTVTVTAPNGKPFTAVPVLPGSSQYYSHNGHWSS